MRIIINEQQPDGLNITVEDIIVDTVEDVNNLIKVLYKCTNPDILKELAGEIK